MIVETKKIVSDGKGGFARICEENETIIILGTTYKLIFASEDEEKRLKDNDGFTDWTSKKIVVRKEYDAKEENLEEMDEYIKKVTRHEIVHAFLVESGLNECSGESCAWAMNESMVDWIARQGPKIYQAWKEAGAL